MAHRRLVAAGSTIAALLVLAYGCSAEDGLPPSADGLPPSADGGPDGTVTPTDSGAPRPSDAGAPDAARDADAAADGGEPTDGGVDGAADAEPSGRIEGVVISLYQSGTDPARIDTAVPQAHVSVAGRPPVDTDPSGHFAIDGVPVGNAVLVNVSKDTDPPNPDGFRLAWSSTQLVVAVRDAQTTQVYPRLAMGCATTIAMGDDAGPPGDAGDAGPSIEQTVAMSDCAPYGDLGSIGFEQGGVVRQGGQPFSGAMRVEALPIAFPVVEQAPLLDGLAAMPGNMRGVAIGGTEVDLESFGATEYRIYDDMTGEALRIAPNRRAHLELEVYRPPSAGVGETFGVSSYDAVSGLWRQEGVAQTTVAAPRIARFTAAHLSWWGIDRPRTSTACVRGTVTGVGVGVPVGAVQAVGTDHGGRAASSLAQGGAFCVNVKPNASVELLANSYAQSTLFVGGRGSVAAGDAGASCAVPAACVDVGALPLAPVTPGCARGRFVTRALPDGGASDTPVPITLPITVRATLNLATERRSDAVLGRVTPSATGDACLPLAPMALSHVLLLEGLRCPNSTWRPTTTITPDRDAGASGSCGTSGCVQLGDVELDCSTPN